MSAPQWRIERGSAAYPARLLDLDRPERPALLHGAGRPEALASLATAPAVTIVGSRQASGYGLRIAERLARDLAAAGIPVVSGMARGIDAAAHRGAMKAGGRTLAVLGGGVLNVFPPEHKGLAEEIVACGAVMSESPPLFAPLSGSFPQRNRIISGLSLGTIVVEAPERSGALITARLAMEQNREIFAVPGRVDSRTARGCHALIRDGAKLVETADDVLEELGPLVEQVSRSDGQVVRNPAELSLNEIEQIVLAAIDTEATPIDRVITEVGLPVPQVLATISVLETRRLVRRLSGSSVARA